MSTLSPLDDREECVPSSLLFAGLVATWLAVLVPMAARRRQPMTRPSEAALSCRVLERPRRRDQEVSPMDDATDRERSSVASSRLAEHPARRADAGDEPRPGFRRGRGGYDAEAAARAARAKYVFRQRMVLALVLLAVATGLFAGGLKLAEGWYAHAAVDLCLVGYLVYLRRQVRVEQTIRARRAARMAGTLPGGRRPARRYDPDARHDDARRDDWDGARDDDGALEGLIPDNLGVTRYSHAPDSRRRRASGRRRRTVAEEVAAREAAARCAAGEDWVDPDDSDDSDDEYRDPAQFDHDDPAELDDQDADELDGFDDGYDEDDDPEAADYPGLPRLPPSPLPERPRGTVVLELDDEDPALHDLDSQLRRGYRRAAGQ